MKFVKLNTVTKEVKKRIEGKKVCDVVEYLLPSKVGPYRGWIGSLEEEYFSAAFVKGILSLSVEEREMCIGKNIVNYAMVEHLHLILADKGIKMETKAELVDAYNMIGSDIDVEEITFRDIMKALNWKLKSRSVTVDDHFLNEPPRPLPEPLSLTIPEIVL